MRVFGIFFGAQGENVEKRKDISEKLVYKNGFVVWSDGGRLVGGFLELCVRAQGAGAAESFAIVDVYTVEHKAVTPCTWVFARASPRTRKAVEASQILSKMMWMVAGAHVRVIIPPVFGQIHGV